MITETISGDRVFRKSDNNVLIRKIGTDETYSEADDFSNEWRVAHGLSAFAYEETDQPIAESEPVEE